MDAFSTSPITAAAWPFIFNRLSAPWKRPLGVTLKSMSPIFSIGVFGLSPPT